MGGGQSTMVPRENTIGEYEAILGERDQRIINMIDNQGKDIAVDFS